MHNPTEDIYLVIWHYEVDEHCHIFEDLAVDYLVEEDDIGIASLP